MPTESPAPEDHLRTYITKRFPDITRGIFEGAPDIPYFAVDQQYLGQNLPPYTPAWPLVQDC